MQAVAAANSYVFLTNSEDVRLGNIPFAGRGGGANCGAGTVPNGRDSIKVLS